MKRNVIILGICFLFVSCASNNFTKKAEKLRKGKKIDVEKIEGLDLEEENKRLMEENEKLKMQIEVYLCEDEYVYDVEPVVIPVTRYVVVKENDVPDIKLKETKILSGKDAVSQSFKDSIVPLTEFKNGMSFFDYNENIQFPIFTRKLAMTTIILNNDEQMIDKDLFMSDSDSWIVTGDIWSSDEGERQIIMIKPKVDNLETNMLIVTNKRLYHFILYSGNKNSTYQPMVRFKYPTDAKFITSSTKRNKPEGVHSNYTSKNIVTSFTDLGSDSTEFVSFNYTINIPVFQKKPDWTPKTVYDDGSHTYILLPEIVLQKEFPAFWEGKNDIVNYQIHPTNHCLVIIDKLIEEVTLRVGKTKVTVKKKKGIPYSIKR